MMMMVLVVLVMMVVVMMVMMVMMVVVEVKLTFARRKRSLYSVTGTKDSVLQVNS